MSPAAHTSDPAFWKKLYEEIERVPDDWDDRKALETLLCFAISPEQAGRLSSRLISRFGSLCGVMDAKASALEALLPNSESVVTLLKLIPPLSRKAALGSLAQKKTSPQQTTVIRTPDEAKARLALYFYGYTAEAVFALYLTGGDELVDCRRVSHGSETLVNVDARRLAEAMLSSAAEKLYLAHNHPRGRPTPSQKDRELTRKLSAELALVGLTLLDHFIFADDTAISLSEFEQNQNS